MAEEYSREMLRRSVASVCRTIGWHGIAAGPMEVLVHVLEKYALTLACAANRYAEHDGRTAPDLDDLALAFSDGGVRVEELREYARCVPPSPLSFEPPHYPLPRESKLGFGARDDPRPPHVDDHLPPMRADATPPVADTVEIVHDGRAEVFKRPAAPPPPSPTAGRRPKTRPDDDDRRSASSRELSSVAMNEAGLLSQAREGRLPEARTPATAPDPAPPEGAARPPPPPSRPDKKGKKKSAESKPERPKKKDSKSKRPADFGPGAASTPTRPPKAKPPPRPLDPPFPNRIPMPIDPDKVKKEAPDRPTIPPPPPIVDRPPFPFPFPNAIIKEEKPDAEKLTSQPDRTKLNIFKKISTKPKDDLSHERTVNDNGAIKIEKTNRGSPHAVREETLKRKAPDAPMFNSAVDLTAKRPAPEPLRDAPEEFDFAKRKIKQEPLDDYPSDPPPPPPPPLEIEPPVKEEKKKEKKRRDPAAAAEKLKKQHEKIEKKQQKAHNKTKEPTMNPYPFLNMAPGLIPGAGFPGLFPNPGLIPGGNLFSSLCENPALRGLLPTDAGPLPNPFSMRNGPGLLNLPTGPGLIPPALVDPHGSGFGRPPRMPRPPNLPPYLRRPSLEVIPIEEEDESRFKPNRTFVNSALTIKEKEKPKVHKTYPNENFLFANLGGSQINTVKRAPSPKGNPVISVPPVKPDVTIKLNSPPNRIKMEPDSDLFSERPLSPNAFREKDKDKSEKKKDKLHKKEKKDKEQKIKKKKDKKEKLKLKLERKKEKEEKQELKDRIKKEKKEKRKEKEKALAVVEGVVPKLTLKLGSSSPMLPASPDTTKKLNIKPIVKKEDYPDSPVAQPVLEPKMPTEPTPSPELASFSALVTRPPKAKLPSKHATVSNFDGTVANSPPDNTSPARKTKPSSSLPKYKRIYFKPIPKRNSSDFDDPINDLGAEDPAMKDAAEKGLQVPVGAHFYKDPQGKEVWICPACGTPDNGTPMIGCDGCDGWYHWVCVGIHVAPGDSEDWYCTSCIAKKTATMSAMAGGQTGKKRGRKPKAEKLKEMHQ